MSTNKSKLMRRRIRLTVDFIVDAPGSSASEILQRLEEVLGVGCEYAPTAIYPGKIHHVSYSELTLIKEDDDEHE